MAANPFTRPDAIELVKLGKTSITLGGVGAAIVIVAASIVVSRLLASGLRRLRERSVNSAPTLYIIERLVTYGLRTVGLLVALSVMGINLTSLAVFAGALGVGVGLGLQGLVKDFASGVSLMFERLVAVGDFVELQNGARGVVHEIGPRSTRIRTNDSTDVIVPNSVLVNEQVINWTLHYSTRRIRVPFVTAFGVDKEVVREAVLKAAHSVSFTAPDDTNRKAQVWLVGFGESSLKFELIVWPTVDAVRRPAAILAAYTWAIDDALRGAGIEVPYPQHDVRLRGLFGEEGDDARAALRLEPRAGRKAKAKAAHISKNDAAEDLKREDPEEPPVPTQGPAKPEPKA
jgi:small-conductance mechanosensitive channel